MIPSAHCHPERSEGPRPPSVKAEQVPRCARDDSAIRNGWLSGRRDRRRLAPACPRHQTLLDIALELLRLAEKGLVRRQRLDRNGRDETRYLRPLQEIVARGITPAEELLEKYRGQWKGSVEPIFDEYAY